MLQNLPFSPHSIKVNAKTKTGSAQTQRMTVTAGLKELKLLNKRITAHIDDLKAIRTRRSSTETVAGVNRKDFEDTARAGFQAIEALLARRDAIKAEIVRSNGCGYPGEVQTKLFRILLA